MAGIGFELRKLFKEEGIVHNIKAYAYSSMITIGPMFLCIFLVLLLQKMMRFYNYNYLEMELYISTVTYSFVFSIILTCGISMVLTRFIADLIYKRKHDQIIASFYGALIIILPICGVISWVFLSGVSASLGYKITAYLFFIELVVIWIQNVYLSALKDYLRIVRSFAAGVFVALIIGFVLFKFTDIQQTTIALLASDVGFAVIVGMTMFHFEQVFPRSKVKKYFSFLQYFKKYPTMFFSGIFVYSGVYVHNFVYWLDPSSLKVADQFRLMPFYDLPVFYAYLTVVPSLVVFVVSVETNFYERFRTYYLNVMKSGTYKSLNKAKNEMQKALLQGLSFLIEVQLLFSVLSVALGLIFLPRIGFTMEQLDLFIVLALGFFFFIIMFVMLHALMYFDDRKGVLIISCIFLISNALATYVTMKMNVNGLGMFLASFIGLLIVLSRLLYILRNIDYYTFCSQPLNSQPISKTKQKQKKKQQKWKTPVTKTMTIFILFVVSTLILTACSNEEVVQSGSDEMEENTVESLVENSENNKLEEDKRLYGRDVDDSIKSLYITILPDKKGDKDPIDWYKLNRVTDRYSEENLNIIISEGTEDGTGPQKGMFGYGEDAANAKISLRGNTARYSSQKSYKIKLFDEAGLWQNQRSLNLNKHSADFSRLRNKLSFDLLEQIPDITSLRTQFVHLYVKDLTGTAQDTYQDYGLYTNIEQPNEMFLKSHWLDPYGYLYKVSFFEFQRYPDQIKSHSDSTYDKGAFESILEIKGRDDHDKLIEMLDDLNNMKIPIDDVIEKYFDLDNFLTWTAINILMDNMDTDANNYYLYSPLNSDKWFILPWDYDGAWGLQRELGSIRPYQAGISNFWGVTLHNRYFRSKEHIQLLVDKVEEMSTYINEETIGNQLDKYKSLVEPFLYSSPDKEFLSKPNSDWEKELQQIKGTPERSVQLFLEDLQKPKPFYMNDVEDDETTLHFSWQISYDFQGEDLFYDIEVAKDPLFTQIVETHKNIKINELQMKKPVKGIYYWKVLVRDSEGNEQVSFELYTDEEGNNHFGIRQFEVY